jgi:glycosyltransferase involved in cell wall biosynthesis
VAALNRLEHVFVGSKYLRDYLIGEGIDPQHIAIVDLEGHTRSVANTVPVYRASDTYRLLFVGRIVYGKGLQYLLEALVHLDESVRLQVAGDGWYLPKAKKLADTLRVADRTHFFGNLTGADLELAYRQADLVVVPSIVPEGCGLVVGEARRRGIRVVVCNSGALPEWADRDPGVIVAPRTDAQGLARIIRKVRAYPSTRIHSSRSIFPSLGDEVIRVLHHARSNRAST